MNTPKRPLWSVLFVGLFPTYSYTFGVPPVCPLRNLGAFEPGNQCRNSLQNRTIAVRDARTAVGCGARRWRPGLRPPGPGEPAGGWAATAAPWPSGGTAQKAGRPSSSTEPPTIPLGRRPVPPKNRHRKAEFGPFLTTRPAEAAFVASSPLRPRERSIRGSGGAVGPLPLSSLRAASGSG